MGQSWSQSELDGRQYAERCLSFESSCLYDELDRCIAAAFEIPSVAVSDRQIQTATQKIKSALEKEGAFKVLHLRALYNRAKGQFYFFADRYGRWELLWGLNGLPKMVAASR